MATRFVLPSGSEVTRAWNGDGFRYELCASTPGDPVKLLPDDIRALSSLVELGHLKDAETFAEEQEPEAQYEKVDETSGDVTKVERP